MDSRATQQCNMCPYVYTVYWLPPASSGFLLARKCNWLAGKMLITCEMRGHTNFNGVALLFIPLLCFNHASISIQKLWWCASYTIAQHAPILKFHWLAIKYKPIHTPKIDNILTTLFRRIYVFRVYIYIVLYFIKMSNGSHNWYGHIFCQLA